MNKYFSIPILIFSLSFSTACLAASEYTLQGILQNNAVDTFAPISSTDMQFIMQKAQIAIAVGNNLVESSSLKKIYQDRGYAPVWVGQRQWNDMAKAFFQVMLDAGSRGLLTRDYLSTDLRALLANSFLSENQWQAEILMSKAFYQLSQDLSIGRVDPQLVDQDIKYTRKAFVDAKLLPQILASSPSQLSEGLDSLEPKIAAYQNLKKALAILREKRATKSWLQMRSKQSFYLGASSSAVRQLKAAVAQQGYSFEYMDDDRISSNDMQVLQTFEFEHGIEPEQVIAGNSMIWRVLNTRVEERIRQVELSMEKLRWLPRDIEDRYVFVNLAATELSVFEQGQVVMQFRTVNGGPYRRTPSMRDVIGSVLFNPTWTAPKSIAIKDKIPKIRADRNYFKKMNMHIIDSHGYVVDENTVDWSISPFTLADRYLYRMEPGLMNALGVVKFPLALNSEDIYMHDTNERELFNSADRLRSSGCMRLEKPQEFAAYVLSREGWTIDQVEATVAHGVPGETFEALKSVRLSRNNYLPVYTLYQTALISNDGKLRFMRDVYGQDARLRARLGLNSAAIEDQTETEQENF